jgi:signal transduction histidine kinase
MKSGLPQSYYFHFEPMGNRVLAFGRLDNEELEKMRRDILSLNRDLNNLTRQLHKKNAQLQQLNKEKNQFLGMAAHDIRKPIGLILSYSEFLIDETADVLNSEQTGFLNTIHTACLFMKKLVDDFLDVSAIEAGKFKLDLQLVDVQKILEQSLRIINFQAIKKKITLQIQIADNIPRVKLDAGKIEQVITNLVSNAIEHTNPETKVTIELSCDPQKLKFSVRDSGQGIGPQEMNRLFNPFEKTSTKKTGGEKSTGLGLVITKKIIETHGGKIWVDSVLGSATTVTFNLPLDIKVL